MGKITYSKRLYGIQGIIIYLIFTLGFIPAISLNFRATPWMALVLDGLIVLYAVLSIFVWRYVMRHQSQREIATYFIGQSLLFFFIFALENTFSQSGAASGNITTVLLLQCCVLEWRWRRIVYVSLMVGMMVISMPFMPFSSILYYGFMSFIIFGALLLVGHLIVSEEESRRLLGETNRKLTEYAAQIEELATTKERNRMAREIHDNLGHYLTAINMQLEAAQAIMPTDPTRAQQAMSKAQGLTKEGLSEIRRSVAALRAEPVESRPLDEAITLLVEEYRANGLSINYHVEGNVRPASASIEMALYRIAQEGLTNIRKHARATRAELELRYDDNGHVRLKMLNDGVTHAINTTGFGLLGIQERVKLLGGTLNIDHIEGQDFSLLVELPA